MAKIRELTVTVRFHRGQRHPGRWQRPEATTSIRRGLDELGAWSCSSWQR